MNTGIDMLEEICCHKIYCRDLPAKSKLCAFDGSDKIINSNSAVPREHVHNIFECYKDMGSLDRGESF